MSARNPLPDRLRVAHLSPAQPNEFDLTPDEASRAQIARDLDLIALPMLRFSGDIRASGGDDWALNGRLVAQLVQPCAITLDPVTTDIDEEVALIFSPHVSTPDEEEVEMGDDSVEPLGQWINIGEIGLEALSLALPTHPLAPGAEMPETAIDPDDEGDSGETRKPFAGLADLMKKGG
ncbi:MAG: YceD family protein [Paracoccus sp. (in: a-proteobacteria)]